MAVNVLQSLVWWRWGSYREMDFINRHHGSRVLISVSCAFGAGLGLKVGARVSEERKLRSGSSFLFQELYKKDYGGHCNGFIFFDRVSGDFENILSAWTMFFPWNKNKQNIRNNLQNLFGQFHLLKKWAPSGRVCTNLLLSLIVISYFSQVVSKGKVTFWGAKVNSLIKDGQIWRLMTSSFLHVNAMHLLVNCYSLNSVGPIVETLTGWKRFLAVYSTSAISSGTFSYFFCNRPSVGASGAVFGLVGALAVFVLRHRNIIADSRQSLEEIFRVIVINMLLGLSTQHIDNWGHMGGLIGGATVSWLVGPAFSVKSIEDGYRVLIDKPPLSYILNFTRHLMR